MNLEKIWLIKQLDLTNLVKHEIYWRCCTEQYLEYLTLLIEFEIQNYEQELGWALLEELHEEEHDVEWLLFGYEEVIDD